MLIFIFVSLRLYILFEIIFEISDFNSLRARKICYYSMCECNANFSFRCLMQSNKLSLVLIFSIVVVFFAVWFRIFEVSNGYYKYEEQHDYPTKFFELSKCMWIVIISMSTIGFGDLAPIIGIAKFFMVVIIIYGIWSLSMIVANLNIQITLNYDEIEAFNKIQSMSRTNLKSKFRSLIKYFLLKKFLNKPEIELNNKLKILCQYNSLQENEMKSIKMNIRKQACIVALYQLKMKQRRHYEITDEFIEFNNINKFKLLTKALNITTKSIKLLSLSKEIQKLTFATNNLSRFIYKLNNVGNLNCYSEIQQNRLVKFPSSIKDYIRLKKIKNKF